MRMLFTKAQRDKLLANGAAFDRDQDFDPKPVVKLFKPDGAATWLLAALDPVNPDLAFGLCDLGFGTPEVGSVSVQEIEDIRGHLGLPVERDCYFAPDKPLSQYANEAISVGRIEA